MTTEPGTPQTAAGRGLARAYPMSPSIVRDVLAIEAEARSARDAEIRAAVERLPKWDKRSVPGGFHVNLAAVLAILDADLRAILDADTPS